MNKLKTTDTGKLPFVLDDIRWIDSGIRDAFKGLFASLGITATNSFKITGCVVTNVNLVYSWTAGYICLMGEILPVDSGSVTIPGTPQVGYGLCWTLETTYDSAGLKIFENGNSHDTYEIRKAKLVYGQYPTNQAGQTDYMPAHASYMHSKLLDLYTSAALLSKLDTSEIIQKLLANEEAWQEVGAGFINDWSNGGGTLETAGYKIDNFGVVFLKGVVAKGTSNSNAMFLLPAKYRPSKTRVFSTCQIGTDGYVYAVPLVSQVQLDGISYKL